MPRIEPISSLRTSRRNARSERLANLGEIAPRHTIATAHGSTTLAVDKRRCRRLKPGIIPRVGSARPSAAALWEGSGRSRRKQIVRRRQPAKLVTAERLQRPVIGAREIVTDDDRLVQRLGQGLDAADEIDGR